MKVENNKIVFVDDAGNRTELSIYFAWKNELRNKNYVFFYDDAMPEELLAGVINEDGSISDVEDDEEYDELDRVLSEYESRNENDENI